VSEVLAEVNFIVYITVCLRYRMKEILLCTMMCVRSTGSVNSDVFQRYKVREILLCIFMCACVT